ncbi:MAG: hypothetical protein M3Q07_04610 [Pseudobdellovibrionaceae bacterium]|nr:hypothetical protein [Pseudobdellovibrionaceae bacterium]
MAAIEARAGGVSCYNEHGSFAMQAPKNWQTQYSNSSGPCAFFFPLGFTFVDSPVVIYPNFIESQEKIELFIEGDLESFMKKAPSIKIEKLPTLKTAKGLSFVMRRILQGPAPTENELIAYHKTKGAVLIVVLSARTVDQLRKNEKIFNAFLQNIEPQSRSLFFGELKKRAETEKSVPGGAEFEREYLEAMAPHVIPAFQKCAKQAKKGFDAVFQVDAKGLIVSWVNKEDNETGLCAREEFRGFKGPIPPFEPFHVNLELSIKP